MFVNITACLNYKFAYFTKKLHTLWVQNNINTFKINQLLGKEKEAFNYTQNK